MGFLHWLFGNPAPDGTQPDNNVRAKAVNEWGGYNPEPSFEQTSQPSQAAARQPDQPAAPAPQPQHDPFHDSRGNKVVPEVEIVRCEPHLSNDEKHLELWVTVKNHSQFEVEVRNVYAFKQHYDLGRFLKPGEEHEVKIYNGDTPANDAEHKVLVQFKLIDANDMFQAEHFVKYHFDHDRYIPAELELIRPIRDI